MSQWWHNGLKVGANYTPPCSPVEAQWVDTGNAQIALNEVDCCWWKTFQDPTLDVLIDTAYRQNLDLKAAGTRILEARAQLAIATANILPQRQQALANYAHGQIGKTANIPLPRTFSIWATGLNASWELDFWGRYRRAMESADAQLGASVENYRDSLVMLLSEVATAYVQLRTFEQRIDFARRNVQIQRGSLELVQQRFNQGIGTELDLSQARANVATTEALIPPLVSGRRQAANQLCILLGVPVYDLERQLPPGSIPQPPLQVAAGVPADLLRRRPDIRAAERAVAAQSAQIGIAESDLYPRFSLNGFVGYVSNDLSNLFRPSSFTGFIIPTVQWNFLNYGRIVNGVVVQDARFQRTVLQYQQTVLAAGREVENALVGFVQTRQQAGSLETSVQEADRSVELVRLQYQQGIVDFNRVFTTQELLVTQQDQLATARGNIALNLIQAYQALGGGWQCFETGPAPIVGPCAPQPVAQRAWLLRPYRGPHKVQSTIPRNSPTAEPIPAGPAVSAGPALTSG